MRYIDEEVCRPIALLRYYGAGVAILILLMWITGPFADCIVGSLLCVATSPLMLYCSYCVSPQNSRIKRRFRLYLGMITGIACTILFSYSGVEVRTVSLPDGVLLGVCAAVTAYLLAIISDFIGSLLFDHVRAFRAEGLCEVCGYDLRGSVSGICPECGTEVSKQGRS